MTAGLSAVQETLKWSRWVGGVEQEGGIQGFPPLARLARRGVSAAPPPPHFAVVGVVKGSMAISIGGKGRGDRGKREEGAEDCEERERERDIPYSKGYLRAEVCEVLVQWMGACGEASGGGGWGLGARQHLGGSAFDLRPKALEGVGEDVCLAPELLGLRGPLVELGVLGAFVLDELRVLVGDRLKHCAYLLRLEEQRQRGGGGVRG